jgi:hypothetical protein
MALQMKNSSSWASARAAPNSQAASVSPRQPSWCSSAMRRSQKSSWRKAASMCAWPSPPRRRSACSTSPTMPAMPSTLSHRALARQCQQGGNVSDGQLAPVQGQHVERHMLVFALRPLPQQLGMFQQGVGTDALQVRQQGLGGQPALRRRHAQEHELAAHIGLHGCRAARVGGRFQHGLQC